LSEVRTYIQTNGHLPNVPTAETVAIEGANLGEMTKTLVEKVEELTLYLLQQQEQLELQKATLELQQTQIEALKLQLAAPKQ
jgi:prolyl-tRNA editing enzyme YbaK/EbsC (Cys-tRNA(Pro) deacylase)